MPRRVRDFLSAVAAAALLATVAAAAPGSARAQSDLAFPGTAGADTGGSDLDLPLEDYLEQAGPRASLVGVGELEIDGHRMLCGRRPTVIDPGFSSWGGAYPGYLILNPERLEGLATVVKLFIYAHECGHQFRGRDEAAADCFAVKRGRRYGWLDEAGLARVCAFMEQLEGDSQHASGPRRCEKMKICYADAAPRASND